MATVSVELDAGRRATTLGEYDAAGNLVRLDAPGEDGLGTALVTDLSGRPTRSTDPSGVEVELRYNRFGEVVEQRFATGWVEIDRDALGRATETREYAADATLTQRVSYAYDLLGRLADSRQDGGLLQEREYDALGRLTLERGEQTFRIEVESGGARVLVTPQPSDVMGGRGCDFTTGVTAEVHTTRIRLDPPVLATKVYVSVPVGGTGVDAFGQAPPDAILNEVAVFEVVSTELSYAYDAAGRLLSDGTFRYGYDAQGRLLTLTRQATDLLARSWTIGPNGLRASETEYDAFGNPTRVRRFVYDGLNLAAEYEDTGAGSVLRRRYVYGFGVDAHLAFIDYDSSGNNPKWRWVVTQGPGSVVQVLDEDGTVLDNRLFNAWGEDLRTPTRGTDFPFGFAGRRQDPETGHYYMRARMYDPATGRFTGPDPIGLAGGVNPYLYAPNDPVNKRDPLGLDWRTDLADFVGWGGRSSTAAATARAFVTNTPASIVTGSVALANAATLGQSEAVSTALDQAYDQMGLSARQRTAHKRPSGGVLGPKEFGGVRSFGLTEYAFPGRIQYGAQHLQVSAGYRLGTAYHEYLHVLGEYGEQIPRALAATVPGQSALDLFIRKLMQ